MADRARCILLIFWHATLSPCTAFISLRRLYPPLRYSLSLLLPLATSSIILPRRARVRDRRAFSSFNPFARSLLATAVVLSSSSPLFRLPLVYISARNGASLDASPSRPLSSLFVLPLAKVLLVHRDSAATLFFFFSLALSPRPSVRRDTAKLEIGRAHV